VLVVKVEIWNRGRRAERRDLARLLVANVSDLADVSSYLVVALGPRGAYHERLLHDHRRSDGPWVLINRATDPTDLRSTPVPEELRPLVSAMLEAITEPGEEV